MISEVLSKGNQMPLHTLLNSKMETSKHRSVRKKRQSSLLEQMERTEDADFKVNTDKCFGKDHLFQKKAIIRGFYGNASYAMCSMQLGVPQGYRFLYVLLLLSEMPCTFSYHFRGLALGSISCRSRYRQFLLDATVGPINLRMTYMPLNRGNLNLPKGTKLYPQFAIAFEASNKDLRKQLVVQFETQLSGYISQWGYDGRLYYLCENNAFHKLESPQNHVVMLSFSRFDMDSSHNTCPREGLWVYSVDTNNRTSLIFHQCGPAVIPADVHPQSILLHFKTRNYCDYGGTGFKAFFSFHPEAQAPQRLASLRFNCSTSAYVTFKKHLECNLENECAADEDETEHCPYSSSKCKGLVSSRNKCYKLIPWEASISFYAAQSQCAKHNGDLAMMKTESEWNDLQKVFQFGKRFSPAWIGARTGVPSPNDIYKNMIKWLDNSIAQNMKGFSDQPPRIIRHKHKIHSDCVSFFYRNTYIINFVKCFLTYKPQPQNFICQQIVQPNITPTAAFPVLSHSQAHTLFQARRSSQWLITCSGGHMVHAFLSCDYASQCWLKEQFLDECRLQKQREFDYNKTSMFECEDARMTLHYTLVCDLREDCPDGSDENFCVDKEKWRGSTRECLESSDEQLCDRAGIPRFHETVRLPPPVSIDFDANQTLIQQPLQDSEPCLQTHFQCIERFCLPVYLYCNGIVDCPDGEDEKNCYSRTCSGFYRCRSSSVCVHADHLCDGWPQCPQRDDEWLCHFTCPVECACQGYAFRCYRFFRVSASPHIRYLDASGSGMKLQDVTGVAFLVWLSLARCGVHHVPEMSLPNLQTLDLANNLLTSIDIDVFMSLTNLKSLILTSNPITQLPANTGGQNHSHLQFLDLSGTNLEGFSSQTLSGFPRILEINISFSKINTIQDRAFSNMSYLRKVDLRGNPLSFYPDDLFNGLLNLQSLYTDDSRLCCAQSLPPTFTSERQCISPQTHMSSCQNLIRHRTHRVLMCVFMFLSVVGNITCLIVKMCVKKNSFSSSLDLLVTNLNVMDLLMGVYISVIAVADWVYGQRYFSVRRVWISSLVCQLSGFVALVSYEGTLFILSFMTVHSLIITNSHRLSIRVTQRHVTAVCCLIWALALVISLIPLVKRDWMVHGHTDNCFAMPTSADSVAGRVYAFATLMVVPLILGCLTCVVQMSVLWVKYFHDDVTLSITERSLKTTQATRLFSIISLDCIRRLAFCLLMLMGESGVMTGDQIHVVNSFFVVPTNSAVNPLLYMISVLQEKQRLVTEQRLMQRLALILPRQRNG